MPQHRSGDESDQHVWPCISGLTLRSKVWFEVNGRFAIGEGGVVLLEAIAAQGSLAAAAREVGWSYRHAWGYVRRAETVLGMKLLTTRPGRGRQRGTLLTEAAADLLTAIAASKKKGDSGAVALLNS